jgi:hypothetical protein
MIQEKVVAEYRREQERAQQPGYVSRYDDFDVEVDLVDDEPISPRPPEAKPERTRIEPGEQHPRPPHTQRTRGVDRKAPERPEDNFGAGIF